MQGKTRLAFVLFQKGLVNVNLFPLCKHFRLALGQARTHGEIGLRQVDGLVVIHRHGCFLLSLSEGFGGPRENRYFNLYSIHKKE